MNPTKPSVHYHPQSSNLHRKHVHTTTIIQSPDALRRRREGGDVEHQRRLRKKAGSVENSMVQLEQVGNGKHGKRGRRDLERRDVFFYLLASRVSVIVSVSG